VRTRLFFNRDVPESSERFTTDQLNLELIIHLFAIFSSSVFHIAMGDKHEPVCCPVLWERALSDCAAAIMF